MGSKAENGVNNDIYMRQIGAVEDTLRCCLQRICELEEEKERWRECHEEMAKEARKWKKLYQDCSGKEQ